MTERQRLQRALMLVKHRAAGHSPTAAWRKVKPGSKISDKNAAKLCNHELGRLKRWLDENPNPGVPWWLEENPGEPDGDGMQEPANSKQCIGVGERPCEAKISRRRKRCPACAAEQISLNQPGYGLNYYRTHREPLDAKRNERWASQHQRERDEAAAAAEQKKREHRANLPQWVEYNGERYCYHPKTGKWDIWSYRDIYDQVGEFVPVPPGDPVPPVPAGAWRQQQREASQPGSASRAERRSNKQQDLPASLGKNRKAAANGASPKPRCTTCKHPDRAAIDAELLQGFSIRTVAGRHGLSVSALQRHRSRHVDSAAVGDILEPAGVGDCWREWDGTQWQRIPAPRRDHLKEVQGRPDSIPGRTVFSPELNGGISRGIYRRKTGRPSSGMAARRRR